MRDGLVYRYDTAETADGLPPGEGAFLVSSLWLADCYQLLVGRRTPADCSSGSSNSATTWAYSPSSTTPKRGRMLGNFPQASHVGLVGTATNLTTKADPAERRTEAG